MYVYLLSFRLPISFCEGGTFLRSVFENSHCIAIVTFLKLKQIQSTFGQKEALKVGSKMLLT